ncbi:MAG: endonuclease/exonuclease/phosphatase family protein [Sinobacteraceae bacterium]|nr:endonuclease/exonuclease/phosphatase family protein [Nevskiaceae bacterium]
MGAFRALLSAILLAATLLAATPLTAIARDIPRVAPGTLRIATFNASLNRAEAGALRRELVSSGQPQIASVATIIRAVQPDLLLINEFDYDADAPQGQRAIDLFHDNYLRGDYPYRFTAPVNTGVPSGVDLDRNGRVGGPNDALGFGLFPGQYGMVVYSRLPIDAARVRSFREFLWRDMPNSLLPLTWYAPEAREVLRLSSKSHWDLPIILPAKVGEPPRLLHFLVAHPTPPAFDGPEDRNGRRNHDEIRLWADYIAPARSSYLRDDAGRRGGLAPAASFVIAADLNADPLDGGSVPGAIDQLLQHPRVNREAAVGKLAPRSARAREVSSQQGGRNREHRGDPALDTADFEDDGNSPGNLRVDYLLPSADLTVCRSGVYWPEDDTLARSSDHRLVWLDIALPGERCPVGE